MTRGRRGLTSIPGVARILGIRASKLEHEVLDHAVEVNTVVEALLDQRQEVAGGDGHLVGVNLRLKYALVRSEHHDLLGTNTDAA